MLRGIGIGSVVFGVAIGFLAAPVRAGDRRLRTVVAVLCGVFALAVVAMVAIGVVAPVLLTIPVLLTVASVLVYGEVRVSGSSTVPESNGVPEPNEVPEPSEVPEAGGADAVTPLFLEEGARWRTVAYGPVFCVIALVSNWRPGRWCTGSR